MEWTFDCCGIFGFCCNFTLLEPLTNGGQPFMQLGSLAILMT